VSLSPQHGASSGCGQPTRGVPAVWGSDEVPTTAHRNNVSQYETFKQYFSDPDWHSATNQATKADMRFGTWKVRSLYSAGSVTAAARELARYKMELVGVQIRWDSGGTVRPGGHNFLYGKRNENRQWGTERFVHRTTVSAVR